MKLSPVPFKTALMTANKLAHVWEIWFRDLQDIVSEAFNNEGDFMPKVYKQTTEPVLKQDYSMAIWIDSGHANATYVVFRRSSGDQVKGQLT